MKKAIIALLISASMLVTPVFADRQVGGWAPAEDITVTTEAQEAFDQATEKLLGVDYEAVALLATQVVAGTNYCILARGTAVSPDAAPAYYYVYVYRDLEGSAELLDIQEIEFGIGVLDETGSIVEDAESGLA